VPSCRPVHPLVRQEIGSAPSPVSPRLDCRRAVSAACRIHGQDSRRFTFYHRQVGLPCIAQGGQSSPGRESPACFYPILSWAVYRTRFLASEGLPACLPLPVFPGCHPSLRAVTLPVSRHWSGCAGLHLPAGGAAAPTGSAVQPGGTCTRQRMGLEPTAGYPAIPITPALGGWFGGLPCRRAGKVLCPSLRAVHSGGQESNLPLRANRLNEPTPQQNTLPGLAGCPFSRDTIISEVSRSDLLASP